MKEFKEVDNGIDIAGEDLSDIFLHKNIGNFDIESIYSKIDSSNLIDTYNAYINEEIDKIVDLSGKDEILFVKNMKEHYGSEETKKLFSKVGYDDITDPIKVKFYFLARIDLYNNLISKYIDILKYNYSQLNIEDSDKMISDLINNKNSHEIIDKIHTYIQNNPELWETDYGASFEKFGGGIAIFDRDDKSVSSTFTIKNMFTNSLIYDVVIYGHGTYFVKGSYVSDDELLILDMYDTIKENNPKLNKNELFNLFMNELSTTQYKTYIDSKKDLNKLINKFKNTVDTSKLSMFELFLSKAHFDWGFARPMKTPYGIYRSVDALILKLIDSGYKSIKLYVCNPNGYEIPDTVKYLKDVTVSYSKGSVLVENSEVLEESIHDFLGTFINKVKDCITNIFDSIKSTASIFLNKSNKSISKKDDNYVKIYNFIEIQNGKLVLSSKIFKNNKELKKYVMNSISDIEKETNNLAHKCRID